MVYLRYNIIPGGINQFLCSFFQMVAMRRRGVEIKFVLPAPGPAGTSTKITIGALPAVLSGVNRTRT